MAITDNLISFWELEEASGTRVDAHGTYDLTDNNTVLQGSGKVGNCADFELDNSESLSVADNADLSGGDLDFTFCAWVNAESLGAFATIAAKHNGLTTVGSEWGLFFNNSGAGSFRLSLYQGVATTLSVTASTLGIPVTATWYFLVCGYDATNDLGFIQGNNGAADTGAFAGGINDTATAFRLGAVDTATLCWDGLIDQAGYWKRVLTADERTFLYNAGAGRAYSELASGSVVPTRGIPFTTIFNRRRGRGRIKKWLRCQKQ